MVTSFSKVLAVLSLGSAILAIGCGGGGGSKTNLRFMNAVPDQATINVLLDGTSVSSSLAYATSSTYVATKAGSRQLQVEGVSATTAFLNQTLSLVSGTNSTVVVANPSATSSGIVLTDDNVAPVTGNIKLRIVNAAPSLGVVDVYLVPANSSMGMPAITGLGFGSSSSYQSLTAGSYTIIFTPHGSTFAFLTTGAISYSAGQNRTVVVMNGQTGGSQIATLNDLN